MADSVDRVFSQCLTAVRRISRLGSARPPADVRAKLYGLYKQAMEGDVEGVVARPEAPGEEQEKWDAWSEQKGLSRTEAKRHYIELLIATMHEHASEQEEGRELVAELEFVWDQIKNNSPDPTSSSSNSYGLLSPPMQAPGGYPETPLPTPGAYSIQTQGGLQEVDPVAQDQALTEEEQQVALEAGLRSPDLGADVFVDAPESSHEAEEREEELQSAARSSERSEGKSDRSSPQEASTPSKAADSPLASPFAPNRARRPMLPPPAKAAATQTEQPLPTAPQPKRTTAAALLPSLAKYLPSTSKPAAPVAPASPISIDSNTAAAISAQNKFHRRIETSLIRLTTEVTALREQLDIQAQQLAANSYSSIIPRPFRSGSISNGNGGKLGAKDLLAMYGKWWLSWLGGVVRHIFVDAVVILAVWLYLKKRRRWSDDKIANEIVKVVTAVAAIFGPVKGAWDGARARMPAMSVRLPGLTWLVEWLRLWGAALVPHRYRLGQLRKKEAAAG